MKAQTLTGLKGVFAVIGGFVSYYLGGWNTMLKVMVLFLILDWFTGVLSASLGKSKHGEGLSSYRGIYGVTKKVMCFALVAVAYGFDTITGKPITRNITVAAITINEMLSILENASLVGVWIPPFLKNILEVTRQKVSEEGKMTDEQ